MKKILFIAIGFLLTGFQLTAQSQWEIDAVNRINPSNPNNPVWKGLSATAEPIALAAPLGMFAISCINHNKKLQIQSAEVMGSLVIATAATQVLKRIVNRPRPYETYTTVFPDKIENGYSFPSGHTTTAFSTAMSLTLITKKWYVSVPAFVWASGVGYSRIYLGQHYPSDIFMGAFIGTASGFASHWLMKKLIPAKPAPVKAIP